MQQFLSSVRTIFASLLSQHSGKTVVEKLSNSVLSMVARQLVSALPRVVPPALLCVASCVFSKAAFVTRCLVCSQMTFLQDFCSLEIPHRALLQEVSTLIELLNGLTAEPGESPNKVGKGCRGAPECA